MSDNGGDSRGEPGRRMTRRDFLGTASLLATAAAGCVRSQNDGNAAATTQAPGGKTHIRFWNGFTGPDGKTMEKIVRQFQKENPDISVAMQIIPWGTYYDKLTLSLAYGGAPELFVVHAGRLPEFASFDVLRPLADRYAESHPALREQDFAPVPWKATFYNGTQYALPLDVHPIGLYYNTALFEEAGIVDGAGRAKPPQTWDEFLEAARLLTRDTDKDGSADQWGFVFTWQRINFMTFAGQFGGGILTPDGRRSLMDSPETIAAAHRMRDLIYKHRVAPRPEGVDAGLAFRQGKVGMALDGIFILTSLQEQKGLRYAGAPVPQFGPQKSAWAGSHLLAQPNARKLPITPEQSRAAWRLMRYLSDQSLTWATGGQVPARVEVVNSPEFADLPVPAAFAKQLPYLKYEPLSPQINALFQFVDPAIEAVLLNLETPEKAMRDATRRINQVLERT